MCPTPVTNRRLHARRPLAASLEFSHDAAGRQYVGRCVDVSKGGLLMYVPATTPVQVGQSLQLAVGGVYRPEFAVLGDEPKMAEVVRVDRHALLTMGHVAVGLKFLEND